MKISIIFLIIIWPTLVHAQLNLESSDFEYSHPFENKLHNTSSIDFRSFANKSPAIDSQIGWLTEGGAISTSLIMKIVDEFSSLDETLDINTSVSLAANYFGASGNFSVEHKTHNFFKTDERTISIIIKLDSYYGKYGYLDPKLNQEAKKLINLDQYENFIRLFGTHFVSHTDNVVRALAVINIRNLDHSTKRKLITDFKSKVEGTYGDLGGSVSASQNLQHLINTANKVSTVDVSFHAVGAGGPPALSDFIQSLDKTNISDILHGFSEFAKTGTKDNSAPVKYYLSPYHRFGLDFERNYSFNSTYINKLDKTLLYISNTIKQLEIIKDKRSNYRSYYTDMLDYYNQQWSIHINLIIQCLDNRNCSERLPVLTKVVWPNNITVDEDFKIQPTYLDTDTSTGNIKDRILYNITIRLEGYILFPDFFNRVEFYYTDDTGQLILIPNFVAGDRIVFDQMVIDYGNIKARQFLAQVDTKSVRLYMNDRGEIVVNQNNLNLAKSIISELSNREYYIKTFSVDGFENMTYLGSLNLSNISSFIKSF